MIPGDRFIATFKSNGTRADGTPYTTFTRLPLAFFDDDRVGWFVTYEGKLEPVDRYPNFAGYETIDRPVGMVPAAPGWNVLIGDDAPVPVVAWVAFDDGMGAISVHGVTVTEDGPAIEADPCWTPSSPTPRYEPVGGWLETEA